MSIIKEIARSAQFAQRLRQGDVPLGRKEQDNAGWQGEKNVSDSVIAGIVIAVLSLLMLVVAWEGIGLLERERDDLQRRIGSARWALAPLLDDILYRSLKSWRKEHPKEKDLELGRTLAGVAFVPGGQRSVTDADRLVRAFYWLNPPPDEEKKFVALLRKLEAKFGVYITVHR